MSVFPKKFEDMYSGPSDYSGNDDDGGVHDIAEFNRKRNQSSGETGGPEKPEQLPLDMTKVAQAYEAISRARRQTTQLGAEASYENSEQELYNLGQLIIQSNWELDEVYNPSQLGDRYAFMLQHGVLAVAGLAQRASYDPAEYAQWVADNFEKQQGPDGPMGADYRRRQSMRLCDSLEMLWLAYEGMFLTEDEVADKSRFLSLVAHYCPTKAFEETSSAQHIFDGVRNSYKILHLLAGPNADNHDDLIDILRELYKEILKRGVGIEEPSSRDINNARVLAWSNWPEI